MSVLGLAVGPPALAGYFLEGPIEGALSTPASIAGGLLVGATGMALADRRPRSRVAIEADWLDGALLGLAQALALAPGVSRSGATLTVARARGFAPDQARLLSGWVGMPVMVGASALRFARLIRGDLSLDTVRVLLLGGVGAFASTLCTARVVSRRRCDSLLPYSLYRAGLSLLVMGTVRSRARRAKDARV
jgi:undecaprenyl-diphosphatase